MKHLKLILSVLVLFLSINIAEMFGWDRILIQQNQQQNKQVIDSITRKQQQKLKSLPDSAADPRWKIQRTVPVFVSDLDQNTLDLKRPDNIQESVEYNDSLNLYYIGSKMGGTYINPPIIMTPEEYRLWSLRREINEYFKRKNEAERKTGGKDKYSFSDMQFDLGPAEKIFGPGGVRIKSQGTAELKFGATMKNIDNPSLPIRNRKTTTMDFDEKINLNVNGKVGDKLNMNLNYNTDATFDFDAKNIKLKYEGKEDDIIKLVEAGNVSFPSNSSLITGASSLFGIRTDMQFGKLKLQTVVSQKKSTSKSVSTKGGSQLTPFDIDASNYEENRHFFLSGYFRGIYDNAMSKLPNLTTGIIVNRVEIWVTNKTGTTDNTRNIVALTDLGENTKVSNHIWTTTGLSVPSNAANTEYSTLANNYGDARNIDQTNTVLDGINGFIGGTDYEKLESARLLSPSEYTVNSSLGYISLRSSLQTDQVLAVAYEYTYGGVTYQVGEFAGDNTDTNKALFVKSLKNTSNNPQQGNWDLMMKNVYYLASNVEKEKFRLDVKYQSDTTGVYLTYLPEVHVKDQPLLKVIGADRLDNNNRPNSNGYFDYVDGYTVSNGRVFLPKVEPFGRSLYAYLVGKGVTADVAKKYVFQELYDSTKTTAKQIAERDKYELVGQFKGSSANVISLGAYNVPQGSVVVTAGGVKLTEGVDYAVDYSAGEVTILNQSIIDAGTGVNVSLESNTDYAQTRKTMLGVNWEYDFTKDFQMSGTVQHLSEQSLTSKVAMGSEPLNNTLWGVNINWKKQSQWLTNVLDKIPFLHCTAPSQISFTGEFAQLIAGQVKGTQDNASYLDDFENTKNSIDVSTPTSWIISSVPSMFPEHTDKTTVASGYNRSLLAWYNIDPLFTRRSSSLTPGYLKSDLDQLSNHYVREVYVNELYPNRQTNTYSGVSNTLPILNLAYYPSERGPYNLSTEINQNGNLLNPSKRWGGMMRKLDTNDFESANIEYIEFWMLDPFIYSDKSSDASSYGGDFYINLGEVSEDVLHDGKKFYESGMPVDGTGGFVTTQWGKIPTQATTTYAFATTPGSRAKQDVGFNGLNDSEEQNFGAYKDFLTSIHGKVTPAVYDSIYADPANDDYHYFRGSDYDQNKTSILDRYKRINNPEGNSPDSEQNKESYDTSYKTGPDVEDINQDYTLNEYEKYYQYHVRIKPGSNNWEVGQNYIVDKRTASVALRNGKTEDVTWYEFRIPLSEYESKVGSISDFTSIRFMRMFMTGFSKPIVLRFGSFDLVRGEWRTYNQQLSNSSAGQGGTMSVSAVSVEENSQKTPVNYVVPPGISRVVDPSQPQLTENNEQALSLMVSNLATGEAKGVYKNTTTDLRQYKRMEMFVHANANESNTTNLSDNDLSVFIRLGSDYKSNYYEYEIPLKLTAPGTYGQYSTADRLKVWPLDNTLDINLSIFTALKKARNKQKSMGHASFNYLFSTYDSEHPNNKVSIIGNPTLGEVKVMIIGVKNNSATIKSGEVWVNELRLKGYDSTGGWAAQGSLNMQLSDVGQVNMTGKYISQGFGGLEQGINERTTDDNKEYSVTTNVELGKFFPDKAKVTAPLYYSVTKEQSKPKFNPMDTDMKLDDALDACATKAERDSLKSIAITNTTNTNLSLSNVNFGIRFDKRHPMPFDPANFSFSYSHSHRYTSGETTVYEREDNWRGMLNYNYSPSYKTFQPLNSLIKSNSRWFDLPRQIGLNYLPQNIGFSSELTRSYYELQERDMESIVNTKLPLTFSEQFLWNREFSLRWDFTNNLHMSFQSATHAEIEEPYAPINKDLYPDHYSAWKDSVWTSIKHWGRPLNYNQSFTMSYQLPINKIPAFDWISGNATYSATYSWVRGTDMDDGTSLGNTITNNRDINVMGSFNLETLYNHIPFLAKANRKFNQPAQRRTRDVNRQNMLPMNKSTFEKEVALLPGTPITINHGKNSRKLLVTAKTKEGRVYKIKYKIIDANKIQIKGNDSMMVKLMVKAKPNPEDKGWYKTTQSLARILMMVRNVSFSYRNQYSMSLPGFMPEIGAAFGQRKGDIMSPGLGFAFGMTGDSYVQKALDHDWLLKNDSVSTPATTNATEDLQLHMTLEPVRSLTIDLTATRTSTKAKSIQYMYVGQPTTQSGTFTMTTISLKGVFESTGNANNGYQSATFDKFCNSLDGFRDRVEAQYANAVYPSYYTGLAGKKFDVANGTVNKYSADVMIPAFLSAYTSSGGGLDIFPTLARLLPNWTLRYSGLSQLAWFRDHFRSININHAYRSIFAVGSYSSFSTFHEYMDGIGFITDATTGNPVPSSMYNVSAVSINESFCPLLGVDVTFNNNLTCKLEYRSTRVLNLSMTSVQINQATSKDWVFGLGYKLNDFNLFNTRPHHKVKITGNSNGNGNNKDSYMQVRDNDFNSNLNIRMDMSYRRQSAITRDIASMTSAASSGNTAWKWTFSADYTLSRLITLTAYYDRQTNTPLLSSNSYPTTTQDFGLSMRFSLTR